jgi:hypothetical protein
VGADGSAGESLGVSVGLSLGASADGDWSDEGGADGDADGTMAAASEPDGAVATPPQAETSSTSAAPAMEARSVLDGL